MLDNKKRTFFISVLGMIGFTEVAISIISGTLKIFTGIEFLKISEENLNQIKGLEKVDGFEKAVSNLNYAFGGQLEYSNKLAGNSILLGIIVIVSAITCFVGIMWMWNLKKKGFLYYIVGQIVPVISFLLIVGFSFSFLWLFSIVFIGLWAYNLKYMS